MRSVRVDAEGRLQGLAELPADGSEGGIPASTAIIKRLLELLVIFVGETTNPTPGANFLDRTDELVPGFIRGELDKPLHRYRALTNGIPEPSRRESNEQDPVEE